MIRFKKDMDFEIRENMRGGGGSVKLFNVLPNEAFPPHCRAIVSLVLEKGCGIGYHEHTGETEVYLCVQGEGIFNDNGEEHIIKPGDIASTGNGASHAVRNEKDEPLILFAAIITEK